MERFALGAAMGAFTFFRTSLNDLWSGALTATVDNPAHVLKGIIGFLGSTIVRGPGQKASRILRAKGLIFATNSHILTSRTWTIRGLVGGLPLRENIFPTASSSKARAARPYTVSVGKTARLPDDIALTQLSSSEKLKFAGFLPRLKRELHVP